MALRIRVTRTALLALICLLTQLLALPLGSLPPAPAQAAARGAGATTGVTRRPSPTARRAWGALRQRPRAMAQGAAGRDIAPPAPVEAPPTATSGTTSTLAPLAQLPLAFEPNVGQTDSSASYLAHGPGYAVYLTATGAVLSIVRPQTEPAAGAGGSYVTPDGHPTPLAAHPSFAQSGVRLRFVGADPHATVAAQNPLATRVNYLLGADPQQWHTDVPTYARVVYSGVYPGVDLVYDGTQGQLEYTWRVAAGADPGAIRLAVDGAQGLAFAADGALVLHTPAGDLRQGLPVAYQEVNGQRQAVDVRYTLGAGNAVGLILGPYDHSQPLVIDPVVSYGTYLGGTNITYGYGIAVDSAGEAYVTGSTCACNFPVVNAYQSTAVSGTEAYVSKFSADGHALLYSTYLGGSGNDSGYGVALDGANNIYVAGSTTSTDFPVAGALPALQSHNAGGTDGFLSKLNAAGTSLLYSTYLGGSGDDEVYGLAVDATGHAYLAGDTTSTTYITTTNALQPSFNNGKPTATCAKPPCDDAFVTKLDTTQGGSNSLDYSTYYGGSNNDKAKGIALDSAGDAYIAGFTVSTDLHTQNPYQAHLDTAISPIDDAFVAELNPTGTGLLYGTYFGGASLDDAYGIALDSGRHVYITGGTNSFDLPTTPGVVQPQDRGSREVFVAKFDPTQAISSSQLLYSTYIGGYDDDWGQAIAVDSAGDAYVTGVADATGYTNNTGNFFPYVHGLVDAVTGNQDAFVAELTPSATAFVYNTPLGGPMNETGYGIAADSAGNAYVVGTANPGSFPVAGAYQPVAQCTSAFVAKLAPLASGGVVPWHASHDVGLGAGLDLRIDLADGHADLSHKRPVHLWAGAGLDDGPDLGQHAGRRGRGLAGGRDPAHGRRADRDRAVHGHKRGRVAVPLRRRGGRDPAVHGLHHAAGPALAARRQHHRLHAERYPERGAVDLRRHGALPGHGRQLWECQYPELHEHGSSPHHDHQQWGPRAQALLRWPGADDGGAEPALAGHGDRARATRGLRVQRGQPAHGTHPGLWEHERADHDVRVQRHAADHHYHAGLPYLAPGLRSGGAAGECGESGVGDGRTSRVHPGLHHGCDVHRRADHSDARGGEPGRARHDHHPG